jgi:pilus assembly protein CpaF
LSLLRRLEQGKGAIPTEIKPKDIKKEDKVVKITEDPYQELKLKIQKRLIEDEDLSIELDRMRKNKAEDDEIEEMLSDVVSTMLIEEGLPLAKAERQKIIQDVIDDVMYWGPITPLLRDPTISEVMVNNARQVYVEKKGKLVLTDINFRDDNHVLQVIEKIVSRVGRRCDESVPYVDARLPDGSRFNAIIPPLALKGPSITIRKFSKDPFTVNDLIGFGTLTREMADFLDACVKARLNIIVSGGTGSGKTTTLNVLSSFIPKDERIVTIEDAAELQLKQEHVVTLEARPPNIEGKGAVTIRDLVRNSLRMRPERIVVGECRGGEALDMLQAMNTGHDGSLTTIHANNPRECIGRLETLVLMAGMNLPQRAIREQIASAIDVIIQQSRLKDGSRKIVYITEVQGMEGDVVILQDIFTFEQTGVDENGKIIGKLKPTGIRPKFAEKFESMGIHLPPAMFLPDK